MRRLARKPAVLQRRRLLCSQPPQLVDPPSKTRVLLEDAIKGVLVAGVSAGLVYGYRAHNRQQEMLERERAREEAIRALDPSDAIGFQAPPRPNGILGTVESGIVELRERTGLPWWSVLAVCAVGLRLSLVPLLRYQMRHASHLASLRPELDAAWAATKKALQGRPQSEQMVQYAAQVRAILQREKCNPLKSIAITLAQIPLFITMVLSVRQMVNSGRYRDMKEGGLFWFEDLTVRDTNYALPALNLSIMVVNLQLAFGKANSMFFKVLHRGMLLLLAATFPIVSQFPAGVFVYWIANSSLSLLQGVLLRRPTIKRLVQGAIPTSSKAVMAAARPGVTNPASESGSVAGRNGPHEMEAIQGIITRYQEANKERPESEKKDPQLVIKEINAALASAKHQGEIDTIAMVSLRVDPEKPEEEPTVVVSVVDEADRAEEKRRIGALIDQLITKYGDPTGGKEGQPDPAVLDEINASLRQAFEKGLISTPAQAKLEKAPDGVWQVQVDLGLGGRLAL